MRSSLVRLADTSSTLRKILHTATSDGPAATSTTVQGWVKSVRAHKSVAFLEITDGTTSETLQAVIKTKGKGVDNTNLAGTVEG
jgi:asparaginyl-tRNA synthetase